MFGQKQNRIERGNHVNPRRINETIINKLEEADQMLKTAKNQTNPEKKNDMLNTVLNIYKNLISEM